MIDERPFSEQVADADARLERLMVLAVQLRDAQVACARLLQEMHAAGDLRVLSYPSFALLGEHVGLGGGEANVLLDFGRALRVDPTLEGHVRGGRIPLPTAALVGQVISRPDLVRPEDDWIGWAQTESTRAIRRRVQKRKEEARLGGEEAYGVTVFVRRQARDAFDRARVVASRKADRVLTTGETFETVVDHYLDTFDPDRVAPGIRRVPPTGTVDGRYVPAAVRRHVYERQAGSCAVPFCDNSIFVEMAHIVAHASGGDREEDNLILLCGFHHFALDAGWMTLCGTAAAPQFFDTKGRDLAKRFEPAPAPSAPAPPAPAPPTPAPPVPAPPDAASAAPMDAPAARTDVETAETGDVETGPSPAAASGTDPPPVPDDPWLRENSPGLVVREYEWDLTNRRTRPDERMRPG